MHLKMIGSKTRFGNSLPTRTLSIKHEMFQNTPHPSVAGPSVSVVVGVWAEVTPASPCFYRSLLGSQQFGFPRAEDLPLQKISLFMTSSFNFGNAPSSPVHNLLIPLCSLLYSRCFFVVLFPRKVLVGEEQ